jgi:hypothetical protein
VSWWPVFASDLGRHARDNAGGLTILPDNPDLISREIEMDPLSRKFKALGYRKIHRDAREAGDLAFFLHREKSTFRRMPKFRGAARPARRRALIDPMTFIAWSGT